MNRLLRLAAAALVALVPAGAVAQSAEPVCEGRDMLTALSPDERARLDAAVASHPYPAGNLWRASRADSTVTVLGTMHIYDPRMDAIVHALSPVIAAADAVYVEATENEMSRMQRELGRNPRILIVGPDDPTLPEQLSPEEWAELRAALEARGIPGFMGAKFRPWYVTMMLGLAPCAMESMATGIKGLDELVMNAAAEADVTVLPLEAWDTAIRIFDLFGKADQIDLVRASLPFANEADAMFATMLESYFSEEHRMLWELTRLSLEALPPDQQPAARENFALMEDALLIRRNLAWMDVILPAAEGRDIVVAVGAAHLSGTDGILNGLAQAGYSLERLDF